MKLYLGETPIKIGGIIYRNNVKYKIVGYETVETEDPDRPSILLKLKEVE